MDNYGLREACGVFGCVARDNMTAEQDVASIIQLGLVGLQHRGQESAGIVTSSGGKFSSAKNMGLVNHVFQEAQLKQLKGSLGIGHTRYSTHGSSDMVNIQPFVVETIDGGMAIAHNGELVNAPSLRRDLLKHGVGLWTESDSEILTHLLINPAGDGEPDGADWLTRIRRAMEKTSISYALLILLKDRIFAVRDPFGNRPLCLGKLLHVIGSEPLDSDYPDEDVDGWLVSSESCVFNTIGAIYHREVMPGEVVEVSSRGFRSCMLVDRPKDQKPAFCFFEYVYFARPDSWFEGQSVYSVRKRCGAQLAREAPVQADLVSTVPDSATAAALQYSRELGIPYQEVFFKNTYIGRTFIQPTPRMRQMGVAKKYGTYEDNFFGKRIVLIDDSIVRGNTMGPIVRLLRRKGAKEVHIRIASPPIRHPCFMGINIPTKEELIANKMTVPEMKEYFGADSLQYLSLEGLLSAIQQNMDQEKNQHGNCTACLNGVYPVKLEW